MALQNPPISLQSYAYQLRKTLLSGVSLNKLLDYHHQHQQFLNEISTVIDITDLSYSERFAWKFIREINILNTSFSPSNTTASKNSNIPGKTHLQLSATNDGVSSIGVYQDLLKVIQSVQKIWFPEMKTLPTICWLKQYSTRKLAHYAQQKDEIAFSLIFDFLEVPAEILSYLAYHELLHRQMGTRRINGRRFAHTSDFKNQEHLFPNWREMDKIIERYIVSTY